MHLPWWVPALWAGGLLWLRPTAVIPALLGYHGLCLAGAWLAHPPLAWGRIPRWGWGLAAALALGAGFLLLTPPLGLLPVAHLDRIRHQWPGGLGGHGVYVVLVNVPLEEAYWRAAVEARHPDWSPLRHGLAFGLHHALPAGIVLGWGWALPALLATTAAGAFWTWRVRREGGLGTPLLTHALADLGLFSLAASQMP